MSESLTTSSYVAATVNKSVKIADCNPKLTIFYSSVNEVKCNRERDFYIENFLKQNKR